MQGLGCCEGFGGGHHTEKRRNFLKICGGVQYSMELQLSIPMITSFCRTRFRIQLREEEEGASGFLP